MQIGNLTVEYYPKKAVYMETKTISLWLQRTSLTSETFTVIDDTQFMHHGKKWMIVLSPKKEVMEKKNQRRTAADYIRKENRGCHSSH